MEGQILRGAVSLGEMESIGEVPPSEIGRRRIFHGHGVVGVVSDRYWVSPDFWR